MTEVKQKTTSYKLDTDFLKLFDDWVLKKNFVKGRAVQAGIWLLMNLSADDREKCFELMNARSTMKEPMQINWPADLLPDTSMSSERPDPAGEDFDPETIRALEEAVKPSPKPRKRVKVGG